MTMATFQEYLMWSSVVPAVPCTTWVLSPEIAAARSSASQLFPVPGSPMRSRPRSLASVTMARSTVPGSPKNFGAILRSSLSAGVAPSAKMRTIFGESFHDVGRDPSSIERSQSSSSAYLTSAGSRRISFAAGSLTFFAVAILDSFDPLAQLILQFDDEFLDVPRQDRQT